MDNQLEKTFNNAISKSSLEDLDSLWALLKYQDIGILRKMKAICKILKIDFEQISEFLPKNDQGWILDRPTRHLVHDILIKYS